MSCWIDFEQFAVVFLLVDVGCTSQGQLLISPPPGNAQMVVDPDEV